MTKCLMYMITTQAKHCPDNQPHLLHAMTDKQNDAQAN